MIDKLKELRTEGEGNCITLIMNTHRTHPQNELDALSLKNLLKDAEARLHKTLAKDEAFQLQKKLYELSEEIDHQHNLESLILFANENQAQYLRLPITVTNRIDIGKRFATRDLIRAMHLEASYYILVLSRQTVRLIEALNDKEIAENTQLFPFENEQYYDTEKKEIANALRQTSLIATFFNQVDKKVQEATKNHKLPILICTEEANFYEYMKMADKKEMYYPVYLNQNWVEHKNHEIVSAAYKIIHSQTIANKTARIEELNSAVNTGKFLSDINDIWNALNTGRVKVLFLDENLFQPAQVLNGSVTLLETKESIESVEGDLVEDIYNEMIAINRNQGGDVVFLSKEVLSKFNGFAAELRY